MSWINLDKHSNSFCDFIYSVTDVIIKPFRVIIPLGGMGLDLSPIFAFIALGFVERIVIKIIIILL